MEEMVYAFRILDPGGSWHGSPDALPEGQFEWSICAFDSGTNPSPFTGQTLEFRHGPMPDDGQPAPMRGYTQVGETDSTRRIRVRADVQAVLFPGHD
jgi:hypothetical protein